ncbi:MAG: helix-turn-helix transcriptional regulator [Bacteroidota bacterium]
MKGKNLGEFEEIVLLVIGILYPQAYGVAIRAEIEERAKRKVGLGALHATLVRLEEKGYVSSQFGEATQKRGGKRKRYFQVTASGQSALVNTRELRNTLWGSIPKNAFNLVEGLNFDLI